MKFTNKWLYVAIFLSATIISGVWFSDGLLKAGGESGLPFYDLGRSYELFSSSWSALGLGTSTGIATAVIPTFKFFSLLASIGIPALVIEFMFFWLAFFVSGVGIYKLVKHLFPETLNSITLAAVYFYWFNPIAVANVWNRFLYNNVVFYAFLPWVLYIVLMGLSSRRLVYSLWFGVASLFFSYTFTSMPSIIVLWGLVFLTIVFHILARKQWRFPILFTLGMILTFTLVNSWWILQVINVYLSPTFSELVNESFSSSGNLSTLIYISNVLGKQSNLLALIHQNFYREGPYWSVIYDLPALKLFLFLPVVMAFITIYKYRTHKHILFFGILLSLSLFLVKGSANPFGELFTFVFSHISLLQIFRNPFEKIGFLLPLSLVPLLAYGLSTLSKKFKLIPLVSLVVFGVYYGAPFWSAQVLRTNKYSKNQWDLRSVSVSPDPAYLKISKYLKDHPSTDRLITLPLGGEGIVYDWKQPYWGVELTNNFLPNSSPSYNTSVPFYSSLVQSLSRYQLSPKIFDFAATLNAKYLFLRGDINYKDSQMANPQTTLSYLAKWETSNLIKPLVKESNLTLYEIDPKFTAQKIFISPALGFANSTDLPAIFADLHLVSSQGAILDTSLSPELNSSLEFPLAIYPFRVFPSHVTQVHSLSDQELVAKLLHVEHLPGSKMYSLALLREKIFTPATADHNVLLDYEINLNGKRAVELYLLAKASAASDVQKTAKGAYLQDVENLRSLVSANPHPPDYILESLSVQLELVGRLDQDLGDKAADLIDKMGLLPRYPAGKVKTDYTILKFAVPQSADYSLVYPDQTDSQLVFVNSRSSPANQKVSLAKGDWEIAIPSPLGDKSSYAFLPSEFSLSQDETKEWNIDLNPVPQHYLFSFDILFTRGDKFLLQVKEDMDNDAISGQILVNQRVEKNSEFHDKRHMEYSFDSRQGANSAHISLLPVKENVCTKNGIGLTTCQFLDHKFQAQITNFHLTSYSPDSPRLVTLPQTPVTNTSSVVNWQQDSPTTYSITLTKTSSAPELLVFSELFDSRWQLTDTATGQKLDSKHFLANAYANGWMVEKPGDYHLILDFTAESWLALGEQISAVTTLLLVGTLLLLGAKKYLHA